MAKIPAFGVVATSVQDLGAQVNQTFRDLENILRHLDFKNNFKSSGTLLGFVKVAADGSISTVTTIPITVTSISVSQPITLTGSVVGLNWNATNLQVTAGALNTVQNINTGASPTFAGLTLTGLSGVLKATAGVVSGSATTSNLPEGSNLYYTDVRARAALSKTDPITYNSGSGAIGLGYNTTNLQVTATQLNTIQDIATSSSPTFVRGTFTQTTGTAPFTISSTTKVTNLNVDQADGFDFDQDVRTTGTPQFARMGLGGAALGAALLGLAAGTTAIAPLQFTSGTSLTTPSNGAVEYDGTNLLYTKNATRKKLGVLHNSTWSGGTFAISSGTFNNDMVPGTMSAGSGSISVIQSQGASSATVTIDTAQGIQTTDLPQFAKLGLGTAAVSTAFLKIAAGTTTVVPIQLTSGTNLTTPVAGGIEFNGTNFFMSPSTTRKQVVITNTVTPAKGSLPIGDGTYYTNNVPTASENLAWTAGTGTLNLSESEGMVWLSTSVHSVADANYTLAKSDRLVRITSLTAARTMTFAGSGGTFIPITIKDESGNAGTFNITCSPPSGTIDGAASKIINTNYGSITYYFDGTNYWKV